MRKFTIEHGLNIPFQARIEPEVGDVTKFVDRVALLGSDYPHLHPKFFVNVGDDVKQGAPLFYDKFQPEVIFTAPASGKIIEINRGERRTLESIVIKIDHGLGHFTFNSYPANELAHLSTDEVRENLLKSGLWTAIRTRPYSEVANPQVLPNSIFITATDTNPFCVDPSFVLSLAEKDFINGLKVFSTFNVQKVFLCISSKLKNKFSKINGIETVCFDGPHPAGLVGTHIHFLDPVSQNKSVWHINYQDVIAIGKLFTTGIFDATRIVSVGGTALKKTKLLKTYLGMSLDGLVKTEELPNTQVRVISGSLLFGRKIDVNSANSYLGRYDLQVSYIEENNKRELLGWIYPGFRKYSASKTVLSKFCSTPKLSFTTAVNGGRRSIVPIGIYEKVFPLDIMITYLLKALAVNDIDEALRLGCLELAEEDLALCTFACPSKNDYCQMLINVLEQIRKEVSI